MTLSRNVKDVMGNVDSLRDEIKGNQKDLQNLTEEMSSKMEEGFKKEQHARQQVQSEIVQGFKNEENARQLVQKELVFMKDEIKNLQNGQATTTFLSSTPQNGLIGTKQRRNKEHGQGKLW